MTREQLYGRFSDKYGVRVTITPAHLVTIDYDGDVEEWGKTDSAWFIETCLDWANKRGYTSPTQAVMDFRRIMHTL